MAMIKCGECGRDVSDKAAACPSCGAPIQARTAPRETTREGGKWEGAGFLMILFGLALLAMAPEESFGARLGAFAGFFGFIVFIIGRLK